MCGLPQLTSTVVASSPHSNLSQALAGPWRAAIPDEDLRRAFSSPTFDDSAWERIEVPGHWRTSSTFAETDEALYRHRFYAEAPKPGRRHWLVFDGLCYQGDIWLDGAYLGDTEGYFEPHVFEITSQLNEASEHLLAVEATCRHQPDLTNKRNITGILQHWDSIQPDLNPGGIWRDVRIEETGPVRIETLRVTVAEADADRAIVQFNATLDAIASHTVIVGTHIDPASDTEGTGQAATTTEEHLLSGGRNVLEWRLAVEQPDLWWPHSLGTQPLYDIRVEVDVAGLQSHVRKRRTGLRRIELRNWIASINGERMFLKGTNFGPGAAEFAGLTMADHKRDIELAKSTGLDLIRMQAHIAHPDFYRQADTLGMLVWQDFPLQWGYARGIRAQAARQAEAMVDLLSHHPSIIIWCGHNEPISLDARPGRRPDAEPTNRFLRKGTMQQELPSWNRTVLDRTVKRAISRSDPSRPVVAHSGVLPHPPQLDGTDSHLYFGWYQGEVNGLTDLAARIPRMVRFVSEFGAQSVPHSDQHINTGQWPYLDWEQLAKVSGLQHQVMEHWVTSTNHTSSDSWAAATRAHQARVIRTQIETLRKLKYRPTGGFCQHFFFDAAPMISCAVLDHDRRPKEPGFQALTEACRQVIVVMDPLDVALVPMIENTHAIHVVSDRRDTIEDAEVHVRLSWPGGERSWNFGGSIEPDSVALIGQITWSVPDNPGSVTLELELRSEQVEAHNRYETIVLR